MACQAKTAMVRAFERWHEDNLGYDPGDVVRKDGTPFLDKHGAPKKKNDPLPRDMGGVTPQTWLYHAGRAVVPKLSSLLVADCAGRVWSSLKSALPYNHHGKSSYRWQAIINYEAGPSEVARTVYRGLAVPAPNRETVMAYMGVSSGKAGVLKGIQEDLESRSGKASALRLPNRW